MKKHQPKESDKSASRSKAEREEWALRAIMDTMYAVGVTARNVEEAEQAIDLAARLMSYVLRRKVTVKQIKKKMAEIVESEMMTRH